MAHSLATRCHREAFWRAAISWKECFRDTQQYSGFRCTKVVNNLCRGGLSIKFIVYAIYYIIFFPQRTVYYVFYKFVTGLPNSNEQQVLLKVLAFYGANLINKYAALFYQGGYFRDNSHIELYQRGILDLLPVLKDQSIALVDAIAPNDFILNSPLGMSDGNVYQHLQRSIVATPGVYERPYWWRDVTYKNYLQNAKL